MAIKTGRIPEWIIAKWGDVNKNSPGKILKKLMTARLITEKPFGRMLKNLNALHPSCEKGNALKKLDSSLRRNENLRLKLTFFGYC
jgi:hypothetical protein